MTRRELLKTISVLGTGAVAAGAWVQMHATARASYVAVTAAPGVDLAHLQRLAGFDAHPAMHVSVLPIEPAAQDLTLLVDGRLLDPTQPHAGAGTLAGFAAELRRRREPGRFLLTVEPARPAGEGVVRFEVDGVLHDQVGLDRDYRRIEVPGAMGTTVFRVEKGRVSVVEASCRHALCRKTGPCASGRIVCAPNRLVATLPAASSLIDAVTG